MSHYATTPVPPRPATQREVANQVDQLRRQLQEQLRQAQRAAIDQASERARQMQQKQIRRIQNSINALDEASRRNLEAMDRRHREQLQKVTKRVYEDIERSQRESEKSRKEMERRINHQIDDLASDVSKQIRGLDNKIQRQQREIKAINEQMEVIVDSIEEMEQNINERFEENEQEIAAIQDDLADIHKRFHDEDELARQTVKTAKALLDMVEKRTLLDRFAPNYEAQDVRQRVKDLSGSPLHGAALTAKAEETITQIWQTERHAVQEKAKHDALVEVAMTQVERVLTVVNENREIEREVEGGEPMMVECDFWSEGEYGRLKKELDDLRAELGDRYNEKLTEARIKEIVRRSAEIEGRILQISAESVTKAVLSEARVETVEDIVNAMESKGWMLKGPIEHPEFDYMGGEVEHDWRKGVCAVLENNVGEEITVIVDPKDDGNILIVHQETSKSGKTDKEVRENMQTIKKEMCGLGYEIGEPTTGEKHIPEMGSTERLGKAHATERIREKLGKG